MSCHGSTEKSHHLRIKRASPFNGLFFSLMIQAFKTRNRFPQLRVFYLVLNSTMTPLAARYYLLAKYDKGERCGDV